MILAYGMDDTYASESKHASNSIAEAIQGKTLIKKLVTNKRTFKIAGSNGRIEEVWIEKGWMYLPNGIIDNKIIW